MTLHLITGIAGQDGILVARHLRARGEDVIGTTLTGDAGKRSCYLEGVDILPLDVRDTDAFAKILTDCQPDVIHNLAATSSVAKSWSHPDLADEVNAQAVIRMLDALRAGRGRATKFVQASSSEIFGSPTTAIVDAATAINPSSPYGESKARAHRAVQEARADGLDATNLILFGHSSALHAANFVLPTIAEQAAEVSLGKRERVELRDPSIARDWGSAEDFAAAFAAAGSQPAGDHVIATGVLSQLNDIAHWALEALGTDAVVEASGEAPRPADSSGIRGDTRGASRDLGWRATTPLRGVISDMARIAVQRLTSGVEEDIAYLR